jgi:hypothetical protein
MQALGHPNTHNKPARRVERYGGAGKLAICRFVLKSGPRKRPQKLLVVF